MIPAWYGLGTALAEVFHDTARLVAESGCSADAGADDSGNAKLHVSAHHRHGLRGAGGGDQRLLTRCGRCAAGLA